MKVSRRLWCCSSVEHPSDILYHCAFTGLQLLPIGSMYYQTQSPLLVFSRRVAMEYAKSWNSEYDFDETLRVIPRRITVSIDVEAAK